MALSHNPARRKVGSIRQLPSGRWEVRVSHGYRMDGKPRRLRDVCDTEEQAEARAYEMAAELTGDLSLGFGCTLAQIWKLYKEDRGKKLAGTTMDAYTWHMESVVLPVLGHLIAEEITPRQIQRVIMSCFILSYWRPGGQPKDHKRFPYWNAYEPQCRDNCCNAEVT